MSSSVLLLTGICFRGQFAIIILFLRVASSALCLAMMMWKAVMRTLSLPVCIVVRWVTEGERSNRKIYWCNPETKAAKCANVRSFSASSSSPVDIQLNPRIIGSFHNSSPQGNFQSLLVLRPVRAPKEDHNNGNAYWSLLTRAAFVVIYTSWGSHSVC